MRLRFLSTEAFKRIGAQTADIAIIDDYANVNGLAHGFYVCSETLLTGLCQVMGEKQNPGSARRLGIARHLNRQPRAISRARNDGCMGATGVNCCSDNLCVLSQGQ